MAGLNPLQGAWKIVNGQLVPTTGGENRLAFGDTGWSDVQLDVSATLNSGRGYGVYFRSDGKADHQRLLLPARPRLRPASFIVRKVVERLGDSTPDRPPPSSPQASRSTARRTPRSSPPSATTW